MALWELLFMMVVLKIPIAYLCIVVWWAIRAEPRPLEGAALPAVVPEPPRPWTRNRAPRQGPHGAPPRATRRGGACMRARARA